MNKKQARITRTDAALHIALTNGSEISFALEGDRLLGIRQVQQGGIDLRNPAKLWKPLITTPQGIHYAEFRLLDACAAENGSVSVSAEAIGLHTGLHEEQDEYLGDVLELTAADEPVVDRLAWTFRPSTLELDGHVFSGFSYAYSFTSSDPARRIWRLFDYATWEVGGHTDGNTLRFQGQVNPPVTRLDGETYFTTSCNYYGAELRGAMGPAERVSFQRLPRMGTIQAFDLLVHEAGVLFNYFDPLVNVMSVLEKHPGEGVLHVVDEVRRPLSGCFETHPKHVLFLHAERALTEAEQQNLWCRAYDFVHERERARHGIEPSPVLPRVWTPQIGSDEFAFGEARGPRERAYYYLADEVLPKWADMGVKEICTPSLWVSDYTVDRMKCKNDTGMHGQLVVSGICCVRVHEIDPLYGGVEGLAYFVKRAHELGLTVQLWWATHLSRRAPIYEERPDFMLMARNGRPNGGGYGQDVIITMNLANPDCLEWEFGKLKALYEATGVDGLFHDSYGNMTFLPTNYADPLRQGQQEAYGHLTERLQKLGMKTITVEGLGPWGVGHFGMGLLPTDPAESRSYQNALDWWLDHPDMVYRLNMGIGASIWPGREDAAKEFAFRCLAHGGRFGFTEHENGLETWRGWLRDQNRLHGLLAPLTGKRTVLPAGRGVLWERPDGTRILFSFAEFEIDVGEPARVCEVTGDGEEPVELAGNVLRAAAWRVYRIG